MYLRGLKRVEDERMKLYLYNNGAMYAQERIHSAKKQASIQYMTYPFEGCELYTDMESIMFYTKEDCIHIVHGIMSFASKHFFDTEVIYDDVLKKYTLRWGHE